MQLLKKSFFARETTKVAEELLSCILVRVTKTGKVLKGQIVETEAYLGLEDDCCHSFGGRRTTRTKVMYWPGGFAYIYFTYGMYHCFNIVTAGSEEPEAVLIRAVEPLKGITEMQKNRGPKDIKNLTNGPGKLCQAFDISKKLNGKSLESDKLYIEKSNRVPDKYIETSSRIGLSENRSACYWPLRFYIKNNLFVSHSNHQ